jgi:hypothetical protein
VLCKRIVTAKMKFLLPFLFASAVLARPLEDEAAPSAVLGEQQHEKKFELVDNM